MASLGTIAKELVGPLGPQSAFVAVLKNRKLVIRLARREVESRYRGSLLGLLWAFIVPLLLLSVYTFVFSVVFSVRWGRLAGSRSEFALLLFCGLIIYNVFNESLGRAPSLMLAHVTYIKKVIFPVEILPWVSLLAAVVNGTISFLILLLGYVVVIGTPPWAVFLVPVICLPVLLMTVGLSLFFSSIGVFVRDTQQFIGILTMILLFMTPIFYPLSAIPIGYQWIARLNPIATAVEQCRDALFAGALPNGVALVTNLACSLFIVWFGNAWFIKTKKGFADVI
jgi:lipopolysaccharide transport system permease protein